ncbi:hypothetical protein AKJ57_01190 [candidate division MSBL1 archaeon SCGC-AAA259A05]|uniref:tRNA-t(6)A37 methylthiotransferase n=1 Tax=candidate division MSBL1 archaeon SCGC-AAA259A05 TaxID=1698259 RepID=A0A133UB97_9EURY|nr:hypothetical protein AKJ57_01190 [candidate division MSBL1 archaeon SCGC-AAA259A05]
MYIHEETYGCTMNQGDTELMLGELESSGHKIVQSIEESDVVLVNTCAVTRTTLNRIVHRLKELAKMDDKKVVVGGCLPLIDLNKIEEIGEFAGIISCRTTEAINEVVERISEGESGIRKISGESRKTSKRRFRGGDISAPLAIAEGCLSDCSYCCVKRARGRLRSFKPDEIVEEVREEVEAGRREIYITAQDTAAYGLDLGTDLPRLLKNVTTIPEKFRVRVGMMNPEYAGKILSDLLRVFESEKIYKFLHLPVQSGNDDVLREMRRGYEVKDFKRIVKSFEEKFPNLYLATDIIVGFPGEDEEAFRDSCDLLKEIKPDKVNLTRFTPMPGTDAKEMKQIRSEEKKRRSKEMTDIVQEISYEKNLNYWGNVTEGLVVKEGRKGGYVTRLPNYKPLIIEEADPGDFIKVKVTEAEPTYLKGEVLKGAD